MFQVPTEGALDKPLAGHLVLGPLGEAFKVKRVHAFGLASGGRILFNYFGLTNCTHIFGLIFPVFFLLLLDHLGQPLPSGLEEVGDAVGVDDATGHNVAKIFVGVLALIKQGVG